MERLTQRLRTGEVLMASEYEEKYTEQEWISMLQDRLAAYEDTRLTPERCAEFARADAEGRYIVMRDAEQEGVARLRELAEATRKAGSSSCRWSLGGRCSARSILNDRGL